MKLIIGDGMDHEEDFSWKTSKPPLIRNSDRGTRTEQRFENVNMKSNSDTIYREYREEDIENLLEDFKQKIADIISGKTKRY